jgi:nucleoside-diphosphate-sugar epimerase
MPFVKARFQNVYGPREILGAGRWRGTYATVWRNVTPTFVWKALHGQTLGLDNGGLVSRDFIFVEDICRGLIACAIRGVPGEAYNIASGAETSIRELAEIILELTGNKAQLNIQPAREIGFRAQVDIRTGLAATVEWTRQHEREIRERMNWHAANMRLIGQPLD